MIPFKIETDYVKDQLAVFREELRNSKGFEWRAWNQAAGWALQHNTNLEEALLWSDTAVSPNFGGDHSFAGYATKAGILSKLGKNAEAAAVMKTAMPLGTMNDIHQYGRTLLTMKQPKEALEVFKSNFAKNPNQFTTLMGMTRGYSANGDYKTALTYATQALAVSPAG